MPDWVAFYHNVMLTAFVITNTLKFVQDEIVDVDACVVCFITESDDMKCLTETLKLAECWNVLKGCDFKVYFISYHVLLDKSSNENFSELIMKTS